MAVQFISMKQIMDNIMENPMLEGLSYERAINHAVDFIRLVGCPKAFTEKTEKLQVKDFKAELPCDFLSMIQVRNKRGQTYRYANDSFHMSEDKRSDDYDLAYKLQNSVLISSKKEDEIEIAYLAITVDREGFPLIPDDVSFSLALEEYIKMKYYRILVEQGKMQPQIYQMVQQEYSWRVGQAQTSLLRLSPDEMESFTNMWNQMFANVREHSKGFKNTGTREFIRNH